MLLTALLAFAAPAPGGALTIPHEKYVLDNGLQVILAPDRSVPFVWVNVWYYVGSKDEIAGRSGFAHLFEHLMFQGSEHSPEDYFKPLQKVGAQINGTTNLDRTNYYDGVPSEQLPLALFQESDRLGWLLPALDDAKLQNQKDVVRNERRQRYDNVPYGQARILLLENVFPAGHPYHIATIGKHEDIEAATLDNVKDFFATWYLPNNASLVLCGDFDPKQAKALVKRWFGDVPAAAEPPQRAEVAPVVLTAQTVVKATDDVPLEKVWLAWPTPALFAEGDADLDLLSSALTDGKDSRLYRTLVHDRQIAKDVSASQGSQMLQSLYVVTATVAPGHTPEEVVAAIDEVLAQARTGGITAEEVALAQTAYEVGFYQGLGSISGKADRLNSYNFSKGDPDWVAEDLARYTAATPATVTAALDRWLPPDRRVLLTISPPVISPPVTP